MRGGNHQKKIKQRKTNIAAQHNNLKYPTPQKEANCAAKKIKKRGSGTEKNLQKIKKCKSEYFGNKNE